MGGGQLLRHSTDQGILLLRSVGRSHRISELPGSLPRLPDAAKETCDPSKCCGEEDTTLAPYAEPLYQHTSLWGDHFPDNLYRIQLCNGERVELLHVCHVWLPVREHVRDGASCRLYFNVLDLSHGAEW